MNIERRIFVDTSAFFAMANKRDEFNSLAHQINEQLVNLDCQLHTTNFIRAECHALLLKRLGHQAADAFLDLIRQAPKGFLIYVTRADEDNALAVLRNHRDKDFSFVDATSFVVMERLHIRTAFTFDDDFRQYGRFRVLS